MAVESSEPANGPFPAGRPARPHFLRPLGSYVASRVTRLQRAHLAGEPEAFVLLARLRRTVGKDALMFPGLRKTMLDGMPGVAGVDDRLAADERAAFAAFALYALHQRSRRHGMHQPGQCLGVMARLLGNATGELERCSGDSTRYYIRTLFQDWSTSFNGWLSGSGEVAYHWTTACWRTNYFGCRPVTQLGYTNGGETTSAAHPPPQADRFMLPRTSLRSARGDAAARRAWAVSAGWAGEVQPGGRPTSAKYLVG